MFNFNHKGHRWGYAFLYCHPGMSESDNMELMGQAVEMYVGKEDRRKIERKDSQYEGVLYTDNKWGVINSLYGQKFEAELDVEGLGKVHLKFLINEQTTGAKGSASNN